MQQINTRRTSVRHHVEVLILLDRTEKSNIFAIVLRATNSTEDCTIYYELLCTIRIIMFKWIIYTKITVIYSSWKRVISMVIFRFLITICIIKPRPSFLLFLNKWSSRHFLHPFFLSLQNNLNKDYFLHLPSHLFCFFTSYYFSLSRHFINIYW